MSGAASTQQVYAYPAAGAMQPHAVQSVTSTGSSNQTNTYGYDLAGDTTARPGQTLTYDPTGKLATVASGGVSQQDVYDASGTLLLRTDGTGSTLFLGETELHQASGSADVSAVRTYTLAGKVIAERTTQPGVSGNGTLDWLGSDVDGTTDLEVDSTTGTVTRRYSDPFGNSRGTVPAWSSDHGFLNKTTDTSTGLTQLGARVYDGTIGRFLSVDPILTSDNPVQNNGYDYSGNNPITNTDPSGDCFVGSSDSFNHYTNCSTGPTKKNPTLRVTHNSVAAPGADQGHIQDYRSGVAMPASTVSRSHPKVNPITPGQLDQVKQLVGEQPGDQPCGAGLAPAVCAQIHKHEPQWDPGPDPDMQASLAGSACVLVCVDGGVDSAGHFTAGFGVGPEAGLSFRGGVQVNAPTGWAATGSCTASFGPVGAYVEGGDGSGTVFGGGGWAPGAKLGCSLGFSYTW